MPLSAVRMAFVPPGMDDPRQRRNCAQQGIDATTDQARDAAR